MGHRIRFFFISLFIFLSIQSFGQEQCNNGTDDDGDGLVDCNDGNCQFAANIEKGCNCADGIDNDGDGQADTLDPECAGFYGLSFVGDSESCDGFDDGSGSGGDVFDFVGPPLETSQNTVDTQSKIAIGDVNCDGIPDVIATSKFNQEIRVIATTDGQPGNKDIGEIIQDFKLTGAGASIFPFGDKFFFELEILIADIDGTCPVEIYSIVSSRTGNGNNEPNQYFLVGFRANPTPSTSTLVPLFDAIPLGTDRPGNIGIADFDCDGEAELFLKDQIYDAETGELLGDGNLGNWDTEVNSAPITADIIEGGNLEIVSGSSLMSVPNLVDGSTQALTVIQDMNDLLPAAEQWYPKTIFDGSEYGTTNWSSTSVADVNNDGHLDIVISGAMGSNSGPTTVYFWDVFNGTVSHYSPPDPSFANGWPWGTSRVNLGDIDGDGKLEMTFIAGNQLFALEESGGILTLKWQRTINDSKSGIVSTTVYDFDNDGNPELVYRDSQELVVVDGETGQNVIWSVPCQSHTSTEGPLIADIDGDGSTDLCAACATANFDINDPIQQQALGQMECYFSGENDWLPTRTVWNQQGYAAVNIADDLSVPCPAFDMTAEFIGDCDGDGVEEINRPLNTFMNQVPTFGQDGCPYFPAPDISFVGNDPSLEPGDPGYVDPSDPNYFPAVEVIPPVCGDLGITVGFNIVNSGSLAITSDLDVSFWEGDPSVAVDPVLGVPATLLHTSVLTLSGLQVGDTLSQGGIVFDYSGSTSTLFIVLNDDGTEFPIDLTANEFAECFIDNNIFDFPITPDPFTVEIEKIADNSNCDAGVSGTDSGELRAVVSRNGVEVVDYSDFAFQWYIGTDDTGTALPISQGGDASSAINLGNGDYALVVTNTDKGCASLPVTENIIQTATTPVATIQVNSNQTICSPPNGELEVVVTGDLTGVTFDWRDEFGTPLGITGPIASDLTEGGYAVIVERNGCPLQLDANIEGPLVPDIVAQVTQNIVSCADVNSGAVTSQVFLSGVLQDPNQYTFTWYFYDIATNSQGSALPPENGSGPSRTGLAAGGYAAYATQISSGCTTTLPAIVEVLDSRLFPTALVVEVAPQTSCDPTNPNGILAVQITNPDGTVGNPADYTIEWFRGSNTLPANLHTNTSADGTQAFAIEDGGIPYTAKVTDVNGCFDTAELTLSSDVNFPVATLIKISDNNICDEVLAGTSFNGAIQLSVMFDGVNVPLPDPNYEITWYDGGSIAASEIAVADVTNPDLTGLPGSQQYTAVITRVDLSCPSNIVTVNVADIQTPPAINFTMFPSTRCIAPFNGGVVLDDVDGVASSATFLASHTVNWYDGAAIKFNGSGVRTPDATGTATYLGTGAGLAPGDQVLLEVIDNSTGCSTTQINTITEGKLKPTFTFNTEDNEVCDETLTTNQFTGEIHIILDLPLANDPGADGIADTYTYTIDGPVTQSNNSGDFLNIPDGTYNVTVTNDDLGCTSDIVPVVVADVQVPPVIDFTMNPNTRCIAPFNGSVTLNIIDAAPVDFTTHTVNWYDGSSIKFTSGVRNPDGTGTATYLGSGLAPGDQVLLEVIDNSTGCSTTQINTITEGKLKPTFTFNTEDNEVCDETLTTNQFTGEIHIILDLPLANDPGADGIADTYTYTIDGPVTQSNNSGDFLNIPDGTYNVTVTNDDLGCTSDIVPVVVADVQVPPVIDFTMNPNTRCIAPFNGSVTLNIIDAAPVDFTTHTVNWYDGSSIKFTSGVRNPDGTGTATYLGSGLAPGDQVLLEVIDNSTGCSTTQINTITEGKLKPTFTFNTEDNEVCDETLTTNQFTGEIHIILDLPLANDPGADGIADTYTYTIDGPVTQSNNSGDFLNIPDGTYNVTVTNDDLGCTSDIVPVVVDDIQILPVISESIQSSTNCSLPDNGELSIVDIDGEANPAVFNTTHTINWYNGNTVVIVAGARVPDFIGDTYAGIPGDANYTVEVIDNATGCNTVETYTLPTSEIDPVVTLNNKNDNAVCDATLATDSPNGFTGFIEVSYSDVNSIPSDTYTISWFTDAAATVDVNTTYPGANIDNSVPGTSRLEFVPGGTYYITVLNDRLGCETSPQQFSIVNLPDPPTPGLIVDANQTSCGSPNGILRLNDIDGILVGAYPDNIDIDWFVGSNTNTPFIDGVDGTISGDELTLTNISSRNYTVQITNLSTGCQDITSILVPEVITKPTVEFVSKTPNNICDIVNLTPNGSITVQVNGGIALPDPNFEFTWYAGETATGTPLTVADINAPTLDGQVEGKYTVTVTDLSTSCVSLPLTEEIFKSTTPPTITTAFVQQTSCDFAGNPNGSVSAVIDAPVTSSGFSVRWYIGTSVPADIFDDSDPRVLTLLSTGVPADGLTAVTSDLPGDLPQGDYTVLVYDEESGCTVQETVTVTQNVVNPVISITPNDHTDCTFDGFLAPNLDAGANVGYEFIWHQGQTTAGSVVYQVTAAFGSGDEILNQTNLQAYNTANPGLVVINNLYSDFYTLEVVDNENLCAINSITSFIDNPEPQLNIKFQAIVRPSDCADAEGVLTAYVDLDDDGVIDELDGELDYSNFKFTWYEGLSSDPDPNFFENSIDSYFSGSELTVDPADKFTTGPVPGGIKEGSVGSNYFQQEDATHGATIYDKISTTYTVVVEDLTGSGCTEIASVFLPFVDAQVTTFILKTDDTDCDPVVGNGNITVIVNEADGSMANQALYDVLLFDVPNPDITTDPAIPNPLPIQTIRRGGYVSDFSVDDDGWIPIGTSLTGNVDGVDDFINPLPLSPKDDVLRIDATGGGFHTITLTGFVIGNTYNVSFDLFIPTNQFIGAGQSNVDGFTMNAPTSAIIVDGRSTSGYVPGEWQNHSASVTITGSQDVIRLILFDGASNSFASSGVPDDDIAFLKNVEITDTTIPTTTFSNLGPGDYSIVSQQDFGSGCYSELLQVTIEDAAQPPVLTPTISHDTWCDNTGSIGDGSISVVPSINPIDIASDVPNSEPDPRTYTYVWSTIDGTPTINGFTETLLGPNPSTITGLAPGTYEVTVTDDDTGCQTIASYQVIDQDFDPALATFALTPTDKCSPDENGVIEINLNNITPNTGVPTIADYSFNIYLKDDVTNALNLQTEGVGNDYLQDASGDPVIQFQGLAPGTYFIEVQMLNATLQGFGCVSPPIEAGEILDISVDPLIDELITTVNNCDPVAAGEIRIEANPISLGVYTFNWYVGADNTAPGFVDGVDGTVYGPGDTHPIDGLVPDHVVYISDLVPNNYTVEFMDPDTKCVTTESYIVDYIPLAPTITALPTSQTECDDDGRAVNGEISITPAIDAVGDYTYELFESLSDYNNDSPSANVTGLNSGVFTELSAGTYYVTATKFQGPTGGLGCETPVVSVVIQDETVQPNIAITPFANTSCDGNFEGSFTILMSTTGGPGDDANNPTYTYTVTGAVTGLVGGGPFVGDGDDDGSDGDDDEFMGIEDDTYTIIATNNLSGCSVTGIVTIQRVEEPIIIQTVDSFNRTTCDLPTGGGSAEVVAITPLGANPINTEYTFEWYETSLGGDFASAIPRGETVSSLTALDQGTYYVVALRNAGFAPGSGCESPPYRVDIADDSVDPTFTATTSANTSCDPGAGEGSLLISNVVGVGDFDLEISGASSGVILARTNDAILGGFPYTQSGLGEDTYTITIYDNGTECFLTQVREIVLSEQPIIITNGSSTDQEYCDETLPGGGGSVTLTGVTPLTGASIVAEYEIFWYRGVLGDDFATASALSGGVPTDTDVETLTDLAEGTYYVQVRRRIGQVPGAGCESSPFRLDVFDVSTAPTFTATTSANTSCDPGSGEGSLVVDNFVGEGTTFDITIDLVNSGGVFQSNVSTTLGYDFSGGIAYNESGLGEGFYQITVRDVTSDCSLIQTREILFSQQPIIITNGSATDQQYCDETAPGGGGSVTLSGVTPLTGASIVAEYEIFWYGGALGDDFATASALNGGVPIATDVETVLNLAEGTYYVQVRRRLGEVPGAGCESAPFRLDVFDVSTAPTFTATASANTSCDPGSAEGFLVVDNFVGEGTSFDITIDLVDAVGVFQSNVSTTPGYDFSGGIAYTESNLGEGFYQITVRDATSDCFLVQTREILFSQQPIIIQTVSSTDQTLCDPFNGTATVTSVSPLGANPIDTEYTFEWFETSLGGDFASATPRPETTTAISSLPQGTYYVRAVRGAFSPGAGCESAPFRVDVFDVSEDPILSYQIPEPDINCFTDATQGNGSVTVNSSVDIVTWDWFERDLNDNGIFNEAIVDDEPLTADDDAFTATSITYSGLAPGTYRLMATDINGCENTTEVEIIRDVTQSTPNVLAVDIIKTTSCGGNGSFQIVEISLGNPNDASNPNASITDPVRIATEFTYQWYFETIDAAGELVAEVGPTLSDVAEGSYFVIVTNIATTCESIPKEVVMEGDEINYPNIVLEQTIPQLSCQSPYSGELTATITEDNGTVPAGPYSFEWLYEGSTVLPTNSVTGRPLEPEIVGNVSVLDSLPVGRFDVNVVNLTTGCAVTALYIIEDESQEFIPVINTGTEPVTNCVSPNGGIFGKAVPFTDANGVNTYPLLPYDYDIDIYTGDLSGTLSDTSPPGDLASVSGASAGVNLLASQVPAGFYTVRIIDNKTGCYSVKADQVFDRQTVPVVEVVEDNPLINCDPARANGQLSATADGGRVGGFDFRWHAGTDTTSAVISNQSRLIGQGAGIFTVVVTNQISGCIAVMSGEITDGTLPAPTPTPELISDRLSCIEPDGALNVSVDGQTAGFTFNWFDAADGEGTLISDNPLIINLDIGNYSVIAINNTTGCESLPANISVGDARVDPEFSFETEGSKCDEDTGLARIIITNEAIVNSVDWTDLTTGAGLGLGSEINFLAPGDYQAEVTTFYGCEGEGVVTVGTVITNYNLVTSDGDGFNDNFQIDCITNFPNNNVKIFNRAGVLVYQIDGYNNEDKSFVGLGEDGVYPIGEELPNGTYYYVIDKRDGSDLIAGFLELIR